MDYLLESSAAAVLMIVGVGVLFASVIVAHMGANGNPNPLLGIAVAVAGLAIQLGAYRLIRNLPCEKAFRTAFNFVLLWGTLSLIVVAVTFVYAHFFRRSSPVIPAEHENARFIYGFSVGALCLATLWLLNVRMRPQLR